MPRGPLTLFIGACAIWVGSAVPVSAQDQQHPPIPARVIETGDLEFVVPAEADMTRRVAEMRRWIHDYQTWREWNEKWRSKREPGWLGTRERRTRPNPPEWLNAACRDGNGYEHDVLADACRLLNDWNDNDASVELRRQMAASRTQRETVKKTVWWEHVHLDALWPMTQVRSSVFGVLGTHATVEVAGRFQVFVAPGAILLNLPNDRGSREWRPATDYGIAYRCFDFTLPGSDRRASLHINLAKAWILAGPSNVFPSSINLAGFSVTLKKTPQ
jgi:hypothetical protein